MSWSAFLNTKRSENKAYSLMGLFGVKMPLLYGEKSKASWPLQEHIMAQLNDQFILAFAPSLDRHILSPKPK